MKKMISAFAVLLCCFCFSQNFIQQASADVTNEQLYANSEEARLINFYSGLKVCRKSNYQSAYGDMRIQENKNGTCYYASTFMGQTFECNFPKQEAQKYSRFKRTIKMSKSHYQEMKEIERKYCRTR